MSVPIADPFPDVATHVVEPEGVRGVLFRGRDSDEAIESGVPFVDREATLVDVGLEFPVGLDFVAPGVEVSGASTAGGEFPFGFGWKAFTGPFRVSFSVFVCNLNNGVVVFPVDGAIWSGGVSPVGTVNIGPPLEVVVEFNGAVSGAKDGRAGNEVFGIGTGEFFDRWGDFGDGDVSRGFDKCFVLSVGHFGGIHPEGIDVDAVNGYGVIGDSGQTAEGFAAIVATHGEFSAGNPDHAVWGWSWSFFGSKACRLEATGGESWICRSCSGAPCRGGRVWFAIGAEQGE